VGITGTLYRILLIAHILCVIVGIGTVFLNGLYGAAAKARRGVEGLAISETNLKVSLIAEYFIYAILLLGILLVLTSDSAWKFSQAWISIALVLFVADLGISHGILIPNVKKMIGLMRELNAAGPPPAGAAGPPPQALEIEQRGKTVGMASVFLNLSVIVFLYLMIFKPGA
jgi:uncharacterized membrane protein